MKQGRINKIKTCSNCYYRRKRCPEKQQITPPTKKIVWQWANTAKQEDATKESNHRQREIGTRWIEDQITKLIFLLNQPNCPLRSLDSSYTSTITIDDRFQTNTRKTELLIKVEEDNTSTHLTIRVFPRLHDFNRSNDYSRDY